jgi:hypothetical protein
MNEDLSNGKLYGYAIPGRFGLGHSLLAWACCFLWCRDNGAAMLAPRWLYFRLGPYLRREMDKRSYHKLFRKDVYIHSPRRLWLLATAARFAAERESEAKLARGTRIVVFENDTHNNGKLFDTILGRHAEVRAELLRIACPEHIPAVNVHGQFIGIHVRMGDFTRVSDPASLRATGNVQLPVEWYKEILLAIRKQAGCDLPARVFSDGDEESLRPLLELPNVTFVRPYSALHDILALSQAAALISSGSGFSQWAAYLGQVPRICFPNQRRHRVLVPLGATDLEPECETGVDVPAEFVAHLTGVLQRLEESPLSA